MGALLLRYDLIRASLTIPSTNDWYTAVRLDIPQILVTIFVESKPGMGCGRLAVCRLFLYALRTLVAVVADPFPAGRPPNLAAVPLPSRNHDVPDCDLKTG